MFRTYCSLMFISLLFILCSPNFSQILITDVEYPSLQPSSHLGFPQHRLVTMTTGTQAPRDHEGASRVRCLELQGVPRTTSLLLAQSSSYYWSHEIKRNLLLGRKAITNLDSILESRGITLLTKVHLVKVMFFPALMYECESWTIKKAEHWRVDAFELWCWRRLLRVPWTARRSNQSILKEISPEYSLEGLMLKPKLQFTLATWYEELTHWKTPWCWETLKAGGEGDNRGWVGWMASPTRWTRVWASSGSWWWTGKPGMLQFVGSQRVGHDWASKLGFLLHSAA